MTQPHNQTDAATHSTGASGKAPSSAPAQGAADAAPNALRNTTHKLLREAAGTTWVLMRILVPIGILVRILRQLGVVEWFGAGLAPFMRVVGLPGEMGLVWATSLVVNIYAGMVVFASLAPELALTTAQVTVLCTMILVAHSLPVEVRIAQRAGSRAAVTCVLRLAGAMLLGLILHRVYVTGGFLQTPNQALWNPGVQPDSWVAWSVSEAKKLLTIFVIVLVLLLVMKILEALRVTALLIRLLEPVLTALGISCKTAPVTVIGMTLGLSYGGGLIIREADSGRIGRRDLFSSLALMGLCHSLIEDSLLMAVLGAHVSGVLWARLIFALVTVALLTRVLRRVPDATFDRFFSRATSGPL